MSWNLAEQPDPATAHVAIEFNTDLFDAESIASVRRALTRTAGQPDRRPRRAAAAAGDADRGRAGRLLAVVAQGPMRPVRESTVVDQFEAQRPASRPTATRWSRRRRRASYAELNAPGQPARRPAARARRAPGATVGLCLRSAPEPTTVRCSRRSRPAPPTCRSTRRIPPPGWPRSPPTPAWCAVIAHAEVRRRVVQPSRACPSLVLDDAARGASRLPGHNPPLAAEPGDPAYVIYTSGSTGQPKGVLHQAPQRGQLHRLDAELFELTPADRILGFASATFDVSVFETFSALLTGARLYLPPTTSGCPSTAAGR